MPLTIFATAQNVAGWPVVVPSEKIDRYLRTATLRVARACNIDPYTYTPTETDAEPLKDATCAQIASWITLGIDPAAAGLDTAPIRKSAILTGNVERDTSGQVAALADAATGLAPEAEDILLQAGLLWLAAPTSQDSGVLVDYGLGSGQVSVDSRDCYWWESSDGWPFL